MPGRPPFAAGLVVAGSISVAGCGWQRHTLTPSAEAVKVTKNEPSGTCDLKGTFFTYRDCLSGMGTGNTDEDAQIECIKWKADSTGGNWAVLDAAAGDGYYKGRIYRCQ
jgi:hypothetical protein